jgi:photosystem II stability/assembly factor-like uncharacterized protein
VLETADGGRTWRDRSLDRDQVLYAIDFADARTGWIVGELGAVLRTEDGGASWTVQRPETEKTLFGIAAVSATEALAVGLDGLVLRTTDGGGSWQVRRGRAELGMLEETGLRDSFENPGLYDVEIRGRRGWVVGDVGTVLTTDDGGDTWTALDAVAERRGRWIRGLSLAADGSGVLVGAAGFVIRVDGDGRRSDRGAES